MEEQISFVFLSNKKYLFVGKTMIKESATISEIIVKAVTIVVKSNIKPDETIEKLLSFFAFKFGITAKAFFKDSRKYNKLVKNI